MEKKKGYWVKRITVNCQFSTVNLKKLCQRKHALGSFTRPIQILNINQPTTMRPRHYLPPSKICACGSTEKEAVKS